MKNLFAKSIDTGKVDHLAVLRAAIGDALEAAQKSGVPFAAILLAMESRTADLRAAEQTRIERRQYGGSAADYQKVARAEEERNAKELARQQAAYRDAVNRRGEEDARRRGKIL